MFSMKAGARDLQTLKSTHLPAFLVFLYICHQNAQADSLGNDISNSNCIFCNNTGCPDSSNCLQQCIDACPPPFYPVTTENSSFVCELLPTTATTTVVTTLTTEASTPTKQSTNLDTQHVDTPSPTTTVVMERRGGEFLENNTTDNVTTTESTTTIQRTTEFSKVICKKCSIKDCNLCKDINHNTVCSICRDGYHLNSDSKICNKDEDTFPVGAIVGIVVGGTCFIVVVVVAVVCVVKRCRNSSGHHVENDLTVISDEEREVYDLGLAPPPPGDDPNKRYDQLQAPYREDSSYSPLENVNNVAYANMKTEQVQHNKNLYGNTHHVGNSLETISPKEQILNNSYVSTSSESTKFYDPVETESVHQDTQEIYANNEVIKAAKSSSNELHDHEEIYINDNQEIDEVYENV